MVHHTRALSLFLIVHGRLDRMDVPKAAKQAVICSELSFFKSSVRKRGEVEPSTLGA